MSSTYENKPIWVRKIDTEIEGCERGRDQHKAFAAEYEKKIDELREKRKQWTDQEASGG